MSRMGPDHINYFLIYGWLDRFRNPFVTRVEGETSDDWKTWLDN